MALRPTPVRLSSAGRFGCLLVAVGCLTVLVVARSISPDDGGTGTHHQLGMRPCGFLERTGLPCGTCGMTTSFSHFSHGNIVASFWVQPFGGALAIATAMAVWAAGYAAVTGRPAYRMLQRVPIGMLMGTILGFWVVGWAWKMWLVISGRDGW